MFILHVGGYWNEERNKRAAFDQFAKENRFDPLNASNWYRVSTTQLQKAKVFSIT
jgi:hypothetical protein